MATTSPARIDDDLYASAKLAGEVQSRSASQQVADWARIGREIEASSSISPRDIAEVLAGSRPYDDLSPREQAVVRAEWSARMDELRSSLNLTSQFSVAGRTWVELDDDGEVVERAATAKARTPKRGQPKRSAAGTSKASAVAGRRAAAKKQTTRAKTTGRGALRTTG